MIGRLVLFGASGDLAGRFLLPALATLQAEDRLPAGFQVTGAARQAWDDHTFRDHAATGLERHAADVPKRARAELLDSLAYRQVDLTDAAEVAAVVGKGEDGSEAAAAYLALPPGIFPDAVGALGRAGLPPGSRIAIEKPFGEDLDSARELNRVLGRAAGSAGEQAIFRVDHVLGMPTTQRLLALRLTNPDLDRVWSSESIEAVELLWEETLALEGRAGYFDHAGTLKDVVQNHLMQLLALVAMEPPAGGGEQELRDAKVAALRSIRPLSAPATETLRGRYEAGTVDGREIPAYADEQGVDPDRETETFAELRLRLESERWRGTEFVLRAGKALASRRKGIMVRFRAGTGLWVGIDGPEDVRLELGESMALSAPPPEGELPAYARVLAEILEGGSALSVRGDEAEEAWKVVTPVLDAWSAREVPLLGYPAGSSGP